MSQTILLSGATGFLGTALAARLVREDGIKIYALVRGEDEAAAAHRLKGMWAHDPALYASVGNQVIPVRGDFTVSGLGIAEEMREQIRGEVTQVIHTGAEIGFQKSKKELGYTNIRGTKNMLAFAAGMQNLQRFVHISTAYVSGMKEGRVTETEPAGTDFSSYYEESKAKAEEMVKKSGLPFSICRPGMIVGDRETGWVRNFNTVYYVLKLLLLGELRVLPLAADTKLNLVPVDYVADAVLKISASDEGLGKAFHLTCPNAMAPTAGELAAYVRSWAGKHLGTSLAAPAFVPMPVLKQAGLMYNKQPDGRTKTFITNLLTLLPYFFSRQDFDRTNTDAVCGEYDCRWQDYMDPLLTFACRKNFMRQSGMTVFEQARVRRESKRYPIHYYNISADGIRKTTGPQVNERIGRTVDAMWAWGIRKGDRVAITGINSTAYMVIEQAIGLLGAVSVPIYYTTPAQEAEMLLERSGAKWFFIGDTRMMDQLDEIHTDAKLVSFSVGKKISRENVLPFNHFLKKADGHAPAQHPDPGDLATIRYTSGTTGEPKGVMFSFGQLAFMGEVLTNLLTWKDRNDHMCYLSFLPLSHVVEGILASYAPYYVLCSVDYYYLNDFGALTEALPKVRPTVFFSVPRFYEKLWDQVVSNRLGKAWMDAPEGPAKQAMAAALRRIVLNRAGLDRCSQLIVGSAPMSEMLLNNFRALGIEVHNAYGQTEAPLITINRLGDNIIPTIGTPLPDTEVTVAPDGELIVRGPQVALGYYGLETETIKDGVLMTGDLGTVDVHGHITLYGRKKDFIVTAYGKNISIPKIEERLKDIPGVSEAVLIGENRPYCTALLWLEREVPDLEAKIEEMNRGLSHPEQIRRFRVIAEPLSIKAGELTPNLKVKRGNVMAHREQEIEEMYQ